MLLKTIWHIVKKDAAIEWRSRELFSTTAFFAVSCLLVFAFGLVREGTAAPDVAPAVLWIAIAFAGTLALGRAFERERQHGTLDALLLAPVDRPAIYLGKLAGILLLMAAVEVLLLPLVALLFDARYLARPLRLILLVSLGTVGFAAIGTLFSAMLLRAHSRDVLLPLVLYPITVPVIIAGVRGTAALCAGPPDVATADLWIGMLVFFDAVFVTLALWTFEAVMTE